MALDRSIFEQRVAVKDTKRHLGIKGDDQDLYNQKVSVFAPAPQHLLTCSLACGKGSQTRSSRRSYVRHGAKASRRITRPYPGFRPVALV
jgi:hypothetical protein